MAGWFRVFLLQEDGPKPSGIMERLQALMPEVNGKFRTDEDGWFQLILSHSVIGELILDHFMASEKGVRSEINTWAAWLESKQQFDLMERIIQVKQILSFEVTPEMEENVPDALVFRRISLALAELAQGFVHIDGIGFLESDGRLLIEDEDAIRADL
ncbi:MAG: hypothetical protein EBT92_10610 [Planctomycetes bacterium]|nr:hypothetical protein [Planctomycetota bacterium]NBY02678.1 hypothetical protein [Planctomycetota bacterium]